MRFRRALILCFPFFVLEVFVFGPYLRDGWLYHAGVARFNDFVALWIAGQHPFQAYDLGTTRAAQQAFTHVRSEFEPFNYPPHFLLALIPLANLSYAAAFLLFDLLAAALYVWSVVAITGRRESAIPALAMPGFIACFITGQTSFLAAGLAGFALLAAERRDSVRAGIALAAMTFKPQFGPLFPVAMALERRWLTLAVATAATVLALALAWLILGPGAFAGFVIALQNDADYGLTRGMDHVEKLQSIFGVARFIGASVAAAWAAQISVAAICAAIVAYIRPGNLRNSALLACSILFSPHVLVYDLVLVSPAAAFLWRDRPLSQWEWSALAASAAITGVFFFRTIPFGVALPLAVVGIALTRNATAGNRASS